MDDDADERGKLFEKNKKTIPLLLLLSWIELQITKEKKTYLYN